jgi:hypothetical protein
MPLGEISPWGSGAKISLTRKTAAAALAATLALCLPAKANIVTVTAQGNVTGFSSALGSVFAFGDAATFTFSYDTASLDSIPAADSGFYGAFSVKLHQPFARSTSQPGKEGSP